MGVFDLWDDFNFEDSSSEYIQEMIFKGAEMGLASNLTQTRTKDELRSRGFSFGNEKFSSLWAGIRDEQAGFNHFSTINMDEHPIDSVLPQRTYFKAKYRYVGSFTAVDEFGEFPNRITLAIDSNKSLTPREALSILEDIATRSYGMTDSEIDSFNLEGALHNPDYNS